MVSRGFAWFCVVSRGFAWFGLVWRGLAWFGMASRSFEKFRVVLNDLCDSHAILCGLVGLS